jgi:hypothetical protein
LPPTAGRSHSSIRLDLEPLPSIHTLSFLHLPLPLPTLAQLLSTPCLLSSPLGIQDKVTSSYNPKHPSPPTLPRLGGASTPTPSTINQPTIPLSLLPSYSSIHPSTPHLPSFLPLPQYSRSPSVPRTYISTRSHNLSTLPCTAPPPLCCRPNLWQPEHTRRASRIARMEHDNTAFL